MSELSHREVLEGLALAQERVLAREGKVRALLDEPGRWARLLSQAALSIQTTPSHPAPLRGALVGVKDIIRVDGWETRCGSILPPELFAGPEASCVTRLREAGALLLGKTVTTEFAYFEPGTTRNPWNAAHTPGGSSSGSAAAVAGGYCPLALGSQTVGSVIRPAAYCGVVGFKPTQGRVPLDGVIPYAPSLDQLGWFTQDVQGSQVAAETLVPDWSSNAHAVTAPVLGVPVGPYLAQATEEGREALRRQVAQLVAAGFVVKEVVVLADIAAVNARHQVICCTEMSVVHRDWFPKYESLYRPRTVAQIRAGQQVTPAALREALGGRKVLRAQLSRAMDDAGVDLWISPSAPGPAPRGLASTGDPAMNLPWTHAGMPVISLPAGRARNGLPLGLQGAARFGADEALLAWSPRLEACLAAQAR